MTLNPTPDAAPRARVAIPATIAGLGAAIVGVLLAAGVDPADVAVVMAWAMGSALDSMAAALGSLT